MLLYLLIFFGLFLVFYGLFSHFPSHQNKQDDKKHKAVWITSVITFLIFLLRSIPNLFGVLIGLLPFLMEYKNRNLNQSPAPSKHDEISEEEALEILGLDKNANEDEIKASFKNLVNKNHPDKGGSSYITNKLVSARDVLLKKNGEKNEH